MLGQHLVLATPCRGLQLVLNKTIRIGDTKYHIIFLFIMKVSVLEWLSYFEHVFPSPLSICLPWRMFSYSQLTTHHSNVGVQDK